MRKKVRNGPRRGYPRRRMNRTSIAHDVESHLVAGEAVPSASADALEVLDPTTGKAIGRIPAGEPNDADRAVVAARAALADWSMRGASERADLLKRWARA